MSATIDITANIAGLVITGKVTKSVTTLEQNVSGTLTLSAAKGGTLTTRTNNTEGTITLTGGHGFGDGAHTIDIYWTGGMRYGVSATVSTNACTITGGAGDNLPIATTAVTAQIQTQSNMTFDGDAMAAIVVGSNKRVSLDFQSTDSTSMKHVEVAAGEAFVWWNAGGFTTPVTGDPVTKVLATCGDSAAAATVKVGVLYDGDGTV